MTDVIGMTIEMEVLLTTIQDLKDRKSMAVEAYDSRIAMLTTQLEAKLKSANMKNLKTDVASAYWQNNTTAEIKDWEAVMRYVKENDAFDLLQRRIASAQLKARLEAGAKIRGASVQTNAVFIIRGKKSENSEG
jgi:hypothetical protein